MREACDLMGSIVASIRSTDEDESRGYLLEILQVVCERTQQKWDTQKAVLDSDNLDIFANATTQLPALTKMPDVEASWKACEEQILACLDDSSSRIESEVVEEWVNMVEVIEVNEPRFLRMIEFPDESSDMISKLIDRIEADIPADVSDGYSDLQSDYEWITTLKGAVESFQRVRGVDSNRVTSVYRALCESFVEVGERLAEMEASFDDYDEGGSTTGGFDVFAIFSDL